MILGAALTAVGRVRPGQIAAALSANATTVNADIQGFGSRFRTGSDHPKQHRMHPRQQGNLAPLAQPPPQGRTGGAAHTGKKLAPLNAFAQKELQSPGNFGHRKARTSAFFRFSLQLPNNTGEQIDGCYSQRSLANDQHLHNMVMFLLDCYSRKPDTCVVPSGLIIGNRLSVSVRKQSWHSQACDHTEDAGEHEQRR